MTGGCIRSFVAIELPDPALEALAVLQRRLKKELPPQAIRWTRPESIHLTLQFLGDVPSNQIDAIADALRRTCTPQQPFDLKLESLGTFPDARRPRIVWVGVVEPTGALQKLHARVGNALRPLGYLPETRRFQPHLTIGRASRQAVSRDLNQVGSYVERSQVGKLAEFHVDQVCLMSSDLRPAGAVYTCQAAIVLAEV